MRLDFFIFFKLLQAKIPSARSLDDIAMDLTEMGTPKVSKLVTLEAKNQLIMASNGSLISSGNTLCECKVVKYNGACVC